GKCLTFPKPLIDGREELTRFNVATLPVPSSCQRGGSPQLPKPRLLAPRNHQGPLQLPYCLPVGAQGQEKFAAEPMQLGLERPFLGSLCQEDRLIQRAQARLGLIVAKRGSEMAKVHWAKYLGVGCVGLPDGSLHHRNALLGIAAPNQLGPMVVARP